MKRNFFYLTFFFFTIAPASAQQAYIDSLKNGIRSETNDTLKLLLVERITNFYGEINPDSAYYYAEWMSAIAKKLNLKLEEALALGESGYSLLNLGNYPWSLQSLLAAISIIEDPKTEKKYPSVCLSAYR